MKMREGGGGPRGRLLPHQIETRNIWKVQKKGTFEIKTRNSALSSTFILEAWIQKGYKCRKKKEKGKAGCLENQLGKWEKYLGSRDFRKVSGRGQKSNGTKKNT